MRVSCQPARSLGAFTRFGVSLLTLIGLVSGCGGYYVEPKSPSLDESAPEVENPRGTPRPAPGVPTSSEPPSGPRRGGFVVVTGDDADDLWHCEENRCGGLYPSLFRAALSRSRSGGQGILAIGVNGAQALAAFNGWNSPTYGGPNARVTHVRAAGDIAKVDFNRFALVYLPSAERHTLGGLTEQQISALNARQPDLARFVNERGGSLIALTQAEVPGGWGFLPLPLQTQDVIFDVAEPTSALREFAPTLSAYELSHKSFHNVFTGPSGFSGLGVLAYNDEPYNPHSGSPMMLGGSAVILTAEDCADGVDNDGDGAVDGQDTDCHVCGNGTVDPGEACDDGNVKDGDGCSATCRKEHRCGNGTVDPGEACDDGNQASGDGCSATCQKENRAPDVTCHDASLCTDPGVCVATVGSDVATAIDLDGDPLTWDLHPQGPYAPGTHGVCVTASDGQAQDSCWSAVTVRDCEAPALVCPADFTVHCSGQGQARVSPPPATATDNCGPASVTQPDAIVLPLGSHTLAYSAVDASGNTATCAPSVTVVDTLPPYLVCPEPIIAECTGRNSAYVNPGVATAVDTCTSAQVSGPMADWYSLGSNVVRYSAKDASGNETSCTSSIEVVDQTPPVVTLSPPTPFWPVDQQYRTVRLEDCIVVHDECSGGLTQTGASAFISCVSSDEPRSGEAPDVVFVDSTTVKVRVDRSSSGDGRVYSLHFEVRDTAGNLTRGICPVGVPLARAGAPVIDSGESWRSCRPVGDAAPWKPISMAE
ncbi:HYR domain-containing protein [Archangium lansingense]|uniref:HYR domain-containing protein n=1 Tax=Archangium lansingense TaxID=2995310 RepID=A0ABT3ZVE1_9BACT|nr:HYR domain-containing protein [Archangium lansinium]MCY1073383.1 HYR domain-containing protein [Archangium lansinium]